MNKKPNPYKPIYSVKKSSKKFQQIQKSTRKLSVENLKEQCLRLGFSLTLPQLSALCERNGKGCKNRVGIKIFRKVKTVRDKF